MSDGRDLLLGPSGLAGFTVHTDREPNAGTRRLMEWLGVEIDVTGRPGFGRDRQASARRVWPRAELVAAIEPLIAEGMTHREVARRLGVSMSALRNARNDPDGQKQRARRDSYMGTCIDCGAETRSDGTSQPSPRCIECAPLAARIWTEESIIEALQEFARRYGKRPSAADFAPALARQIMARVSEDKRPRYQEMADRFERDACWPWTHTITERFGSFPAALEAACLGVNPRQARWTKERIIERMQEWERETGAPPTYNGWVRIDLAWPCVAVCTYHFGRWSSALEAAGFEPQRRGRSVMGVYHVLHKNGDGAFQATTVEAHSPALAIEQVADSEGEWIAVLERYWVVETVASQTKLAVVKR